ncbi:5'-methylthioadenosine/adenosylhomocysteine nucleosidase [Pseudorhodoferax sp.]|uniref:5'-methylthioadenosine/adenosylhomocysteine nucleosidase n=1 Tax=Pseudorhodoferax sp. TaxID=1993553 RepID=UPI002DD68FEF|nr:5'-methylthioadenosine/adenosylhomocysteine nucleosidase [Pseudorhodoferax sp.]
MTTALLSALPEEQQGLVELLQSRATRRLAGRDFHTGELWGEPVVVTLSRIGKVAAATTATLLAECFAPRRMVFTGVAGGLAPGVQVGDVVVSAALLQHDMDASPLFPRHEVPLLGLSRFAGDAALVDALVQAARTALGAARVHQGLVVSGDRFVSSAAESLALQAGLPDALAVDMESAAVAQVCHDYGLPFAAVRSISDRADDTAHVDFPVFVRDVASPCAHAILAQWLRG